MFTQRKLLLSTLLMASTVLVAPVAMAHTSSVGYENAGPGAVTFWYGTYHAGTNFTEGSLQVTGPNSYNVTQAFTQVVQSKPAGLIDGTTNFYSDGSQLVGTPTTTILAWQGATLTNLQPGTYTFTYIPIGSPTQTWQPIDSIILSSSVFLSQSVVGGSLQPNAGGGASSAAGMLDQIESGSPSGDMAAILTTLGSLSPDEQKAALNRIAPQTSQAISSASTQAISGALDSVSVRLDSLRNEGYKTASADTLSRGGEIQVASLNGDLSPILSGTGNRNSFWSKAFGSYAKQGFDQGFNGYQAKTGGMAFGADTLLDSDWVVGAAATYAATRVDMSNYRNGDNADIGSYQATLYTSRDFGSWYVEGMAAGAYQTFNTKRDTGFGDANGDFDGWNFATRATVGKSFPVATKTKITPSLGLEYNHLTESSYSEREAGPLNLDIKANSANRLRSVLQTQVTTELQGGGYKFVPGAHIGWRHEFVNDGVDSTATFTGGGSSFTTQGQNTQRDTLNLGLSMSASQTQDFTLSVQADTELANKYSSYSGQLVAQWRF